MSKTSIGGLWRVCVHTESRNAGKVIGGVYLVRLSEGDTNDAQQSASYAFHETGQEVLDRLAVEDWTEQFHAARCGEGESVPDHKDILFAWESGLKVWGPKIPQEMDQTEWERVSRSPAVVTPA